MQNIKHTSQGFTIVELMVAMVIISALLFSIAVLTDSVRKNQQQTWENYIKVDEANTAVRTFTRELRTARDGNNGAYLLAEAGDNQISFYSDIDFDGQTEKVRYYLSGTEFYKGTIEPTGYPVTYPSANEIVKLISANIRNGSQPPFYYFNSDWPKDTINNPLIPKKRISDTRLVRIYLRLNTQENQPEKDYVLENYVQIRMLKDNL